MFKIGEFSKLSRISIRMLRHYDEMDPMFKIGEFSKLSRISIRMLRHYDEIGLLVPEETDPWTGYRRYAAAQLMTANRITALRGLGFSLAETAALLACWEDRTAMETRLLAQRAAVEASIQEALDRLRLLDTTIERLRKDEKQMNYDGACWPSGQRWRPPFRRHWTGCGFWTQPSNG